MIVLYLIHCVDASFVKKRKWNLNLHEFIWEGQEGLLLNIELSRKTKEKLRAEGGYKKRIDRTEVTAFS